MWGSVCWVCLCVLTAVSGLKAAVSKQQREERREGKRKGGREEGREGGREGGREMEGRRE